MHYDALLLDSLDSQTALVAHFCHLRILSYAHDIVRFLLQALPPRMTFTCHGATLLVARGVPFFRHTRVPTVLMARYLGTKRRGILSPLLGTVPWKHFIPGWARHLCGLSRSTKNIPACVTAVIDNNPAMELCVLRS